MSENDNISNENVMLVMAYTDDYSIGRICEQVNRHYASLHNYAFASSVLSCDDMAQLILPKVHFTWYKIWLLRALMEQILSGSSTVNDHIMANALRHSPIEMHSNIEYLCWIDADAMVIRHDQPMQHILKQGQYKELIIAEDMHIGNKINAGVFCLKVCPWSLQLLEEMWQCTKYDKTFYYEQSALTRILMLQKEKLDRLRPFHSYSPGGPKGVKLFPHVAVFPHLEYSSNEGIEDQELATLLKMLNIRQQLGLHTSNEELIQAVIASGEEVDEGLRCLLLVDPVPDLFIYHVAGLRGKLDYLRAAVIKFKLHCTFEEDLDKIEFRLQRGKLGQYSAERVQDIEMRKQLKLERDSTKAENINNT